MTGKLKIIKCLGNPKPRKILKARKALRRRKILRRNPKAAAPVQKFGLRAITGDRNTGKNWRTLWWSGAKWGTAESKAKRFTKDEARKALITVAKPPGWFVVDGIAL